MIIGISNVHTGDLVLPGLLVVGLFWGAYLGKRLIDLWIDSMRRHSTLDQHAHDAHRLAETGRTPTWPNMVVPNDDEPQEEAPTNVVPLASRPQFALAEPAVVISGSPDRFHLPTAGPGQAGVLIPDASEPEISHPRHAAPEPAVTTVFPVVDDKRALAVVASVSGEDGAG